MLIPVKDRGKYLRGLLIIAKMDDVISEMDRTIIINTAKHLGYASDFYEGILNTLLINEYIGNEPIRFDSTDLAKHFLIDAINLAGANKKLSSEEINWLRSTASMNLVERNWLEEKLRESYHNISANNITQLAVYWYS
jgi:hypothetical protein